LESCIPPKNHIIIIFDILIKDYSLQTIIYNFLFGVFGVCPSCGVENCFKIHSNYFKYYYWERIQILVLYCKECKKFHAVIPSFSLPGTSLGSQEVEQLYIGVNNNQTYLEAGKGLLENGISEDHLGYIVNKTIPRMINHMQTMFPGPRQTSEANYAAIAYDGLEYIEYFLRPDTCEQFILKINSYCLSHQVNAIFCSRYNIINFTKRKSGVYNSNKITPSSGDGIALDST